MSILGPKADKQIEETWMMAQRAEKENLRHHAEVERLLSVIAEVALRGAK